MAKFQAAIAISCGLVLQCANFIEAKPTFCGDSPASPLLSLPGLPSLPMLNLGLGGDEEPCRCSPILIPPPLPPPPPPYPTPCASPPSVSLLPLPQLPPPPPITLPQASCPTQSVTIPNIIVALLPPVPKSASVVRKPCSPPYSAPLLPLPLPAPSISMPITQPYPMPLCETPCDC